MALAQLDPRRVRTASAPRRGGTPAELWFAGYAAGTALGVLAALVALAGPYLAARPRRLEQRYGLDRLLGRHRVVRRAS